MKARATVTVEVIYALPERQRAVEVTLPAGATVRMAVRASRLDRYFPGLDLEHGAVGVWGRVVADGAVLADGDRVELYRPLLADPREQRRRRASGD